MRGNYDPSQCDLCGSGDYSELINVGTCRAMRSDRALVKASLIKYSCKTCGLVRSGTVFEERELESLYRGEYGVSTQPEHYFYTPKGPIARAAVMCDWMVSSLGTSRWESANRVFEIGAGAGGVLELLQLRFPNARFEGLECSPRAVELGRQRGLTIHHTDVENLRGEPMDLCFAIAVLEHVPSPTRFLQSIRDRLAPGGTLILIQPTQDVPSYDVFFFDHLYHFGTEHLQLYARKCGFDELNRTVGHCLMPNFSLHIWKAADLRRPFSLPRKPGDTMCASAVEHILADMRGLDQLLSQLLAAGRRVAVFGLQEVYWLASAYSRLGSYPIVCGLDDSPEKSEYRQLRFPVLKPEDCLALGVQDVILTMNKIYYVQAQNRLERLNLTVHRLFN